MKAIQVQDDETKSLRWQEVPTPQPGPGDVLIRVRATAVNRADLLQRVGAYPPPKGASDILGLEAAGEIEQVGPGVEDWRVGQAVCSLLPGGGYAEYVVVPQDMLLPIPDGLSMTDAAAIPEVFYTAYLNIFIEAAHQPGESVLVHAGASGVGTVAIQLCRAFGAPVIATASAPKLEFLREMGVLAAIDRKNEDFSARVDEITDGRGVDIILDPVGASYLAKNIHTLSTGGRLVIIGLLGGAEAPLPLARLLRKRLRVIGSVLRSRTPQEKARFTDEIRRKVWPLLESGALRPVIDEVFDIRDANEAHDRVRHNKTIGKLVLKLP